MPKEYVITEKGVNVDGKRLKVGSRFFLKDGEDIPRHMVGKCAEATEENLRTAITNPAEDAINHPVSGQERQTLLGDIAKKLEDDQFTKSGVPHLQSLNSMIENEDDFFTAEERDKLWPGISAAVKVARQFKQG